MVASKAECFLTYLVQFALGVWVGSEMPVFAQCPWDPKTLCGLWVLKRGWELLAGGLLRLEVYGAAPKFMLCFLGHFQVNPFLLSALLLLKRAAVDSCLPWQCERILPAVWLLGPETCPIPQLSQKAQVWGSIPLSLVFREGGVHLGLGATVLGDTGFYCFLSWAWDCSWDVGPCLLGGPLHSAWGSVACASAQVDQRDLPLPSLLLPNPGHSKSSLEVKRDMKTYPQVLKTRLCSGV